MKPLGKLRYLQHEKKVSVNFATATDKDIFSTRKNCYGFGKEKQLTPSLSGISANNQCSNLKWIMYFACSFEAVMSLFHVLLFFLKWSLPSCVIF